MHQMKNFISPAVELHKAHLNKGYDTQMIDHYFEHFM